MAKRRRSAARGCGCGCSRRTTWQRPSAHSAERWRPFPRCCALSSDDGDVAGHGLSVAVVVQGKADPVAFVRLVLSLYGSDVKENVGAVFLRNEAESAALQELLDRAF